MSTCTRPPSVSSSAVLNQIETLVCDFVRLKEESAFNLMNSELDGLADLMGSDDENYQLGGELGQTSC